MLNSYLYLSYHRPHPPYDPPAWAFEHFLHAPLPPPAIGDWAEDGGGRWDSFSHDTMRGKLRPDLLRRARAGYFGHMMHLDQQINRFLYTLREYRLYENTWICFTSDHGELLGDHYLFRKSLPYEGSARVPLLLRAPGSETLPRGAISDALVEQRDLMPTLLAAADLPIPASIEGCNLLPVARGDVAAVRDVLHGELGLSPEQMLSSTGQSAQWLTDGRWKYIWFSADGREQLFDLRDDPMECRDLARNGSAEALLQPWCERLVAFLAGREEGFVQHGRLVPGRKVVATLRHPKPAVTLNNMSARRAASVRSTL
ncbi:MAG: sulfatase-like hydrolase/transferase [Opitutaceae bacterium]